MPELAGVFPVLPTPFGSDGRPDEDALHRLADFALESGADGIVYPGMASEVETLTPEERAALVSILGEHLRGRLPFIVGASDPDPARAAERAREGAAHGAIAAMTMAPPRAGQDIPAQTAFFGAVAAACPIPIMLQNAPPPAGSGLPVDVVLDVVRAVPAIAYVKEEALPSGARITRLIENVPASLRGVLGGAGGRYITDELARGAIGTMPAVELAELHVALLGAHRRGDRKAVRQWFERMLPVLNLQAVFRWALTKEVLRRRGIIAHAGKRAAGPELDAGDQRELGECLDALSDVLDPPVASR